MDSFRDGVFYLFVWRAFLVGLGALVSMITQSASLDAALLIGANIALLFALALMVQASRMSDARLVRSEPWRILPASHRPGGAAGRRIACNYLHTTSLRFAKGASVVAMIFSASALLVASD